MGDGRLDPLTAADIAQMLRDLRSDPYTWQQPAGSRAGHFSLAGAQTKFALHRTADGWARASGRIPTTRVNKQGRFKYLRVEDWRKFAASANVDVDVIDAALDVYAPGIVDAVADAARAIDLDANERAFAARFTDALAEHIGRVTGN